MIHVHERGQRRGLRLHADARAGTAERLAAGERRADLAGGSRTRWCPAATSLDCWVRRDRVGGDLAVQGLRLLDFVVYGTAPRRGRRRRSSADVERRGAERGAARLSDTPSSSCARSAARRRSAAAGGARWELLSLIAVTDFKKTYFGTALGYLWSIARPLMLFGVLLAVFTQVFRIGSEVPELSGPAAVQHRAVRLLPGGHDHRGDLDRQPGVGGPQDAVPAPGDPAGGGAHHASSTSA